MKVAVICSNGKVGKLVVKEAFKRNFDVTAIARNKNESIANKFIKKDLFDLTKEDLKDFDIVVDAFGVFENDMLYQHSKSLKHLCDILSQTNTRLYVVGGAGSLYTDKHHSTQLKDSNDFPEMYKPLANAQSKALDELRKRTDVNWTFISPAMDFQVNGKRTGKYILGGEELIFNSKGENFISYEDYAIAMVDDFTKGNYIHQRICVIAE